MEFSNKFLKSFKERMQIYNESRDEDIKRMLDTSFLEVEYLIGDFQGENDLEFIDLVFNRTRYDYNDQVEFFKENFQQTILDLSFKRMVGDDNED